MDRIVIEVGDNVALRWRNATPEVKEEIGKDLEKQLDDILRIKNKTNFDMHLKLAREEAASNGLTEEILQKLLNEE